MFASMDRSEVGIPIIAVLTTEASKAAFPGTYLVGDRRNQV